MRKENENKREKKIIMWYSWENSSGEKEKEKENGRERRGGYEGKDTIHYYSHFK